MNPDPRTLDGAVALGSVGLSWTCCRDRVAKRCAEFYNTFHVSNLDSPAAQVTAMT